MIFNFRSPIVCILWLFGVLLLASLASSKSNKPIHRLVTQVGSDNERMFITEQELNEYI